MQTQAQQVEPDLQHVTKALMSSQTLLSIFLSRITVVTPFKPLWADFQFYFVLLLILNKKHH